MAKKDTSDLQELIQSMTQTEKRYFKMKTSWMKGEEETNYLRLFEHLSSPVESKKPAPEFKRPDLLRSALYDRLVKVLSEYHASNDASISFMQQMQGFYVLKSKGLMHLAKKQLLRMDKSLDKTAYPFFDAMLQINFRESMLVADTSEWSYEELERVRLEFNQSAAAGLARENILHAVWFGYKRLQDILEVKQEEEKKEINQLLKNVIQLRSMLDFPVDPGFELYIINFGIAASAVLRDFSRMMIFANEAIRLKGKESKFFDKHPAQSFRVVSNYGYAALYNFDFHAANLAVEQMRQMNFGNDYILETKNCFNYLVIDLVRIQYEPFDQKRAEQLNRECTLFLMRRSLSGLFAINISYLKSLLAYQCGDLKTAKKHLYQLVSEDPKDVNVRSVFVSAYFVYLCLLWEEEDNTLLQSQMRRCAREIKGIVGLNESEIIFFELITSTSFLKKGSKILDRKMRNTYDRIHKLHLEGKSYFNPTFFSFSHWLLAVLEGKNYFEVLRSSNN